MEDETKGWGGVGKAEIGTKRAEREKQRETERRGEEERRTENISKASASRREELVGSEQRGTSDSHQGEGG